MPDRAKTRRWILPLATLLLALASLRPLCFTYHLMTGYLFQYLRVNEARAVGHFARLFEWRRGLRVPGGVLFHAADDLALVRRYARMAGADRQRLVAPARERWQRAPYSLYLAVMAGEDCDRVVADDLLAAGLGDSGLDRFTLAAIERSGPRGPDRPAWLYALADFARQQGNPVLAGRMAALTGGQLPGATPRHVACVGRRIDWRHLLLERDAGLSSSPRVASLPLLSTDCANGRWVGGWAWGRGNPYFFTGSGGDSLHWLGLHGDGRPGGGYLTRRTPVVGRGEHLLLAIRYQTHSPRMKVAIALRGRFSPPVELPPTGSEWGWLLCLDGAPPDRPEAAVRPSLRIDGTGLVRVREIVLADPAIRFAAVRPWSWFALSDVVACRFSAPVLHRPAPGV